MPFSSQICVTDNRRLNLSFYHTYPDQDAALGGFPERTQPLCQERDMPDFSQAFQKTMDHEGGWCNTPGDHGGETYREISRVYHPKWPGWPLIDRLKNASGVPVIRGADLESLNGMVETFYRSEFWERCGCDRIGHQGVAEELFDSAVNVGVVAAQTWLQESINILNIRFRLSGQLTMDGPEHARRRGQDAGAWGWLAAVPADERIPVRPLRHPGAQESQPGQIPGRRLARPDRVGDLRITALPAEAYLMG
ncbi:MAG: hypothetical protein HQL64_17100 [Magnetococcales bacterium]|nr:hypothetical protein [Magnetococcales bacterium]